MKFHTENGSTCVDMTREEFLGLYDRTGETLERTDASDTMTWWRYMAYTHPKGRPLRRWYAGHRDDIGRIVTGTILVDGEAIVAPMPEDAEPQAHRATSDASHATSQVLRAVEALVDEEAAGETLAEVRRTLELIRAVVGVGR